jgi:hypothetical protein
MERSGAMGRLLIGGGILIGYLLGGTLTAAAEEVRQQLNAPMILKLLARPSEAPDAALKETLRRDAATPALKSPTEWETLPDGSARYKGPGGTGITVSVRNPCPPGDFAHEAAQLRALPGRRR